MSLKFVNGFNLILGQKSLWLKNQFKWISLKKENTFEIIIRDINRNSYPLKSMNWYPSAKIHVPFKHYVINKNIIFSHKWKNHWKNKKINNCSRCRNFLIYVIKYFVKCFSLFFLSVQIQTCWAEIFII